MVHMGSSPDELQTSLESRAEKLRKALQYWQIWEAEYDACKEEISKLNDDATADEMVWFGSFRYT
jgi:unconventional prefoldin RPB5 interactor 1